MSIEWPLVFFTLFVGLGCGTFVASIVMTEWYGKEEQIKVKGVLIALIALIIGGVSSVLHLGHPERIFGALGHPTSGIFMESTMIGLLGLDIIIYLLALQRNATARTRKIIGTIGIVLALVLAFAVGDSYVMSARPAWDTIILPAFYLVSAGIMGCFSLSTLIALTQNTGAKGAFGTGETTADATAATASQPEAMFLIRRAVLIIFGLQAALLIAFLVHAAVVPYPDASRSVTRILAGDLAPLFWVGLVLAGFLIPIAFIMTRSGVKRAERISLLTRSALGLGCVLIGGVAFRVLMFSIGSSIKQYF